jgi:hypothetical protein
MVAFDFTDDLSGSGSSFSKLKKGNVRVQVRFREANDNPIVMLLKMYWDAEILITADRRILTDF